MSSPDGNPQSYGLTLFPPPPKDKRNSPGKPSTRRHASSQSAVDRAQSPDIPNNDGRRSALDGRVSPPANGQPPQDGRESAMGGRSSALGHRSSPITVPAPVAQTPPGQFRGPSPLPDPSVLARSNSTVSHSSIAKNKSQIDFSQNGEPIIHSIFPRYNPELPLEHQRYYPTQTSPTHIPRTVISKRPYSPSLDERSSLGLQSPMATGVSPGRFPRGIQEIAPSPAEASTTEELRELWKVTNGWRVSSSEGRSFSLKMTKMEEEPVFTLSSSTQPFYTLRLDPTSTSAQVTLTRLDPSRPAIKTNGLLSKLALLPESDEVIEVLNTTLEEPARRLPPNDGLEALLFPRAAANMAADLTKKISRSDDASILAAVERECGRLVWDEDSQKHYLVHPSLTTPFIVSINSSPAWSRAEYILEHSELPHNLVRLVTDATGGTLEVNTAVAARIDCFYIVDVAVCALMLVAISEEKDKNYDRFEAPPSIAPNSPKPDKGKGKKSPRIEEFEMDLESQDSVKAAKEKESPKKSRNCILSMLWGMIKCIVWILTTVIKCLAAIIIGLSKCLTSKKS
ncbi:hypothetical protein BP6252_07101 [Coleophoma cylindrospora]|uniref:Acetylserotonin methytransferase-like protein n=1 Tax=Coleophoma cylindrospora TaxID=1849047 RepID=A0A3D8RH28_9HELO|nr:hypothetical protein BP6252_07101 [Coleophoma cylindrospora]